MAYSIVGSIVSAAISASVLGLLGLARRRFAVKSTPTFGGGWSIEELSERFAVTQWLVGASMVLIGAAIAWGIHSVLVGASEFVAASDAPSNIVLFPQPAIWWFLPGFAALSLMWDATLWVWSRIGDANEVMLYNRWTTAKAGFDSTRVLRIMAVVIVLPTAILTALEIPVHISLGPAEIRARGYGFGGTQIYRYSEARKLTLIQGFRNRDGKLVKRAGIVLDFSDGRRWSSASIGDFEPNVDPKLLSFLQEKTGLSTHYAMVESNIR